MQLENLYNSIKNYFIEFLNEYILSLYNLIQVIFIFVLLGLSKLLSSKFKDKIINLIPDSIIIKNSLNQLFQIIIYTILLWIYILISSLFNIPIYLISIITNLLTAWIIISLLSDLINNELISKIFSVLIWIIAALHILGIYDNLIGILNKISYSSGNINISLLVIIQGILTLFMFMWIAIKVSKYSEQKIKKSDTFNPSIRELLTKIFKFIIYTAVILITMSSLGIDLTTLAVVGGAVGVGIGFGLQKIVSNFISGIIILLDKSVKPGDIIEIDDVYGQVKSIGLRFISLLTLDGKEYIIPNEDLITKPVINWSYSNNLVRTSIEVGVSYNSDVNKVIKLIEKSTKEIDRILNSPEPKVFLKEFANSSVNIEVKFWIKDPDNGISNIKSEVNKKIWNLFKEHNIEIPFPQQDIHFKSVSSNLKELLKNNYKE